MRENTIIRERLDNDGYYAGRDITTFIQRSSWNDKDVCLCFNGGTGLGKTTSVMRILPGVLKNLLGRNVRISLIESRSLTRDQIQQEYADLLADNFQSGISEVLQRKKFCELIMKNEFIEPDVLVVDEAHSLARDAGYAEDCGIMAHWLISGRKKSRIIFVTANDIYFDSFFHYFFPEEMTIKYLYPDYTRWYRTNHFVRHINFIKTHRPDEVYEKEINRLLYQKGIIFCKGAGTACKLWEKLLDCGVRAEFVVSQSNETPAEISEIDKTLRKYYNVTEQEVIDNLSGGKNKSLADICEMRDKWRIREGRQGVREQLVNQIFPDDVDCLIATDTLQEGLSLKEEVDIKYMFIDGYSDVEVTQKCGRYRGNLDTLYIIFNCKTEGSSLQYQLNHFDKLYQMSPYELKKEYEKQRETFHDKYNFIEQVYLGNNSFSYQINKCYEFEIRQREQEYSALQNELYSARQKYLALQRRGYEDITVSERNDVINELRDSLLKTTIPKYYGLPLKYNVQDSFVADFAAAGFLGKKNERPNFQMCLKWARENGYEVKTKKATKQDIERNPQLKLRENFLTIVSGPPLQKQEIGNSPDFSAQIE